MTESPPLLVFADDWGRHPSSCQHLVRELLPTYQVIWVNTIGTRPPKLNFSTLKRGLGKLRQWSSQSKKGLIANENLQVLNPRMWPGFSTAWQRRLNRSLLLSQLLPVLQKMSQPPIAISTIPIVADVMKRLPVQSWVYYCVDDFSIWPGLDGRTLGFMEREMLPQTNSIIAASEHLQERLRSLGYSSNLLTHGVNLDFWKMASDDEVIPGLESLERPLIVFWGVIDQRMDISFVRQLSQEIDTGTIVLAGPEDEPDAELRRLPRVKLQGALPLKSLPRMAQAASVLIMPYADLPVTQAMQPLKLKEYLATGKPAVVRNLPANKTWSDCLDVVETPSEFVSKVKERISNGILAEQMLARRRLVDESWKSKAETFARLLHNDMKRDSPSIA
ncbi:MAG TPA: glycosyltransferase [Gemmatales bacterium]|nr:glycosyltransferase [Gemmatales bacterium]